MFVHAITVFLVCLALIFLPMPENLQYNNQDLKIVAANFKHYQGAASQYFSENPGTVGVIPQGSMNLMPGYNAIGAWQNQVSGGVLYSYVPNGQRLIHNVLDEMKNSRRVGLNRAGRLVSPLYGDLGLALPAFIPEGSLVTVSQ